MPIRSESALLRALHQAEETEARTVSLYMIRCKCQHAIAYYGEFAAFVAMVERHLVSHAHHKALAREPKWQDAPFLA